MEVKDTDGRIILKFMLNRMRRHSSQQALMKKGLISQNPGISSLAEQQFISSIIWIVIHYMKYFPGCSG
jgi:hypothetical protein